MYAYVGYPDYRRLSTRVVWSEAPKRTSRICTSWLELATVRGGKAGDVCGHYHIISSVILPRCSHTAREENYTPGSVSESVHVNNVEMHKCSGM